MARFFIPEKPGMYAVSLFEDGRVHVRSLYSYENFNAMFLKSALPEKPVMCNKPRWCVFCWLAEEVRLQEVELHRWEDDGGPAFDRPARVVVLDSLR